MHCRRWEVHILRWHEGTLDHDAEVLLLRHLETCVRCRTLADKASVLDGLFSKSPEPALPLLLKERIVSTVSESMRQDSIRTPMVAGPRTTNYDKRGPSLDKKIPGDQREPDSLEVLGERGSWEETLYQKGPSPEASFFIRSAVSRFFCFFASFRPALAGVVLVLGIGLGLMTGWNLARSMIGHALPSSQDLVSLAGIGDPGGSSFPEFILTDGNGRIGQ